MKYIIKYILFLLLLIGFTPFISHAQIIQAEYFWDSDPGVGSGNAMTAYDGNFNNIIESAIKNNPSLPSLGMHTLSIRVKAADGNWSPVFSEVFSVENLIQTNGALKITQAELFFDADPGEGLAIQMIAFDGNFNDAFETVIKNGVTLPAIGMHTLNIRIKASDGKWSPVFTEVFSVENLIQTNGALKITQAELFFDADPGEGLATQMLAFDGNYSDALESVIKSSVTLPTIGMHTLNIRIKAADGKWSPVFSEIFSVENLIQNNGALKITQAEFFWDTDPGNGNGTPMLAFDGHFSDAMETIQNNYQTNTLSLGVHALYVRTKAADGNWGPKFGTVINMDTSLVPVVTAINGTSTFCSNDNLNNISYNVINVSGDTYLWSIIGGSIVNGGTSSTVIVNWNAGGTTHELSIVQTNGYGSSIPVTKSITILSASFAFVSNDTTICAYQNISLSAGGGTSYHWSSGQTTSSINVAPSVSSMYKVTVSNGSCSDIDTVIVTVIPLPSLPTAGNNGPVNIGSPLLLTASSISNATYSWTGPNSFTSSQQNPTVSSSATLAMAGTYNVTATVNGCTGPSGSTIVVVNSTSSDSACGTEEFNNGIIAPSGWVFTNIGTGSTYTTVANSGNAIPSLKLDATGDIVETALVHDVSQLSFWIKGNGTDATSALLVEGYNGSNWISVDNISNISSTAGITKTYNNVSTFSKFRYTYTKSAGNLAFDDVEVICGSSVGIKDIINENAITIYPNPTNKLLTVSIPEKTRQINILNALGQNVISVIPNGKSSIDFNLEAEGIYFVQIIGEKKIVTKKLVVVK